MMECKVITKETLETSQILCAHMPYFCWPGHIINKLELKFQWFNYMTARLQAKT